MGKWSADNQQGKRNPNYRHGWNGTPEYTAWRNMKSRCATPRYAHRGITVCRRWAKFENFLVDIGPRPSASMTVERLNNNIGYRPSNCVWATQKTQMRNTSFNRMIKFGGKTLCASAWAERFGIGVHLIYQWNRRGNLRLRFEKLTQLGERP